MTQDEIIDKDEVLKMARQAGFVCLMPDEAMDMIGGIFEGDINLLGNFEAFAKLVADVATAKEREACAEIVENADTPDGWDNNHIAIAIRARGGNKE